MEPPRPVVGRRAVLVAAVVVTLAGCGIPRDPDHSLDRVRERGLLRIGVSPASPWTLVGEQALGEAAQVSVTDAGVPLGGVEVGLAAGFADHLGVQAQWLVDGEAGLVEQVELGHLDLLVAGLTSDTQWSTRVGITRAFTEAPDGHGTMRGHVMGVPLGENALLGVLERFLDAQPASAKGGG